jgi:hypothetical protein
VGSSAGGPASAPHTASSGSSIRDGGDSDSGVLHAAPGAARAAGTSGCDFSHQHDPADRLLLRDAPPWVRQRVAAMDRDAAAPQVRASGSWAAGSMRWSDVGAFMSKLGVVMLLGPVQSNPSALATALPDGHTGSEQTEQ